MKIAQGALLYGDDYSAAQLQPNLPTQGSKAKDRFYCNGTQVQTSAPGPGILTEGNEGNEGGPDPSKIQSLFSSLSSV